MVFGFRSFFISLAALVSVSFLFHVLNALEGRDGQLCEGGWEIGQEAEVGKWICEFPSQPPEPSATCPLWPANPRLLGAMVLVLLPSFQAPFLLAESSSFQVLCPRPVWLRKQVSSFGERELYFRICETVR